MPLVADMDEGAERVERNGARNGLGNAVRKRGVTAIRNGEQAGVQIIADRARADHRIGDHRCFRIGRRAKNHGRLVSPVAAGKVDQDSVVSCFLGLSAEAWTGIAHCRIILSQRGGEDH